MEKENNKKVLVVGSKEDFEKVRHEFDDDVVVVEPDDVQAIREYEEALGHYYQITKTEEFDRIIKLVNELEPKVPKRFRNVKARPVRDSVKEPKIGRNNPCPCGSGLKYKKCCINN